MKRRIVLVLIFLMILPNFIFAESLSFESEIKYGPFGKDQTESDVGYSIFNLQPIETAYNYGELKSLIYNYMKSYDNDFSIQYKGDTSKLGDDISRIWDEIFEKDEYLFGNVKTYGAYSYEGYKNDVLIKFHSFTYHATKSQEEFVESEVNKVLQEIINSGMSEFEKVKAINDWVVLNTEYSTATKTSPHAAYTLFKEGKGVCQAYALATYKLLDRAGMEVRYVTGNAGGERHAWNQVKVDGKWYNLDTTWNDPMPNNLDRVSYAYFLMSDKSIGKDHFPDGGKVYEIANDTRYEYMNEMVHSTTIGDYIYYSSRNDGDRLYKNKIGINEKIKLTDNRALYIVGYGDWIYYSNYSNGGYLYKVKTNGTENTKLNGVHSIGLYIEDSYLNYYNDSDKKWEELELFKAADDRYKMFSLNESKKDMKYTWKVRLNQPVKPETVNFDSVYVEDEYGLKLNQDNFSVEISEEDKKVINVKVVNGQGYLKNELYYIVVDEILESIKGNKLISPVKMPFIIR